MELNQLEKMCEVLYNASGDLERKAAEQALQIFSTNSDYIPQCQFILENSLSPYAQHLASSSLVKQITDHTLPLTLRFDIRAYVLTYLASKGPSLQPFVTSSLIQLLCRISKLGWWDDDQFRETVKESASFLAQSSADHVYIGLKILNQLVAEMNQITPNSVVSQHRKTSCSFRDYSLLEIFGIALSSLQRLTSNSEEKLKEQAIALALKCLSFDFVGTTQDESAEDLGIIQVPSAWRNVLEQPETTQLFFDYYSSTKPPLSNLSLECLVRLASVRRSLFTGETERIKFLSHLMNGTRDILRSQTGMTEHENYHEYCRLLGRLKTNYQLSELVNVECYNEWIRLVADFTIKSLQSWQWASGSVFYLLGLWSRLVSSMPYLKTDSPSLLENFVPRITEVYVSSRLDSVQSVIQNNLSEDPLENEEQLQDQLDSMPNLCRFQYEKTSKFIIARLEPLVQAYKDSSLSQSIVDGNQLQIMEGQLTWLVHIVGAIIRGRLSSSSADSQEILDAEVSARVFQLLQITDTGSLVQRYHYRSKQRLDLAILSFFQSFRKVYIGDQAMHSSKALYSRLAELLGIQDHLTALNVVVRKIASNLKCYTKCEQVIEETLNLFQELAGGYTSGKLLLKLDAIVFILGNHTREHFPFLEEFGRSQNRTTFYFTLCRLLFVEDSPSKFKAFIAPLQQVLVGLEATPDMSFRTDMVKYAIIGLMRDLRGVTMATNSRRNFGLLFDWLHPAHTPLLLRCIEHYIDTPEVTTPLLKFMAEFVTNKTNRLAFESSSPNGILLFREVSKLIVAYGSRVLQLPATNDPYLHKYKGIWIALTILSKALAGNYVNFGVFELYGDPSLSDALSIALKMSLSVPLADIMAFRKLGRAYFALIEVLCQNHTQVLVNLDTPTFKHIVGSIETGLKFLDVGVSSQCASAIDNIAAFYFNNVVSPEAISPPSQSAISIVKHISECPLMFPEILKCLFEIVLFEECGNQWSLSRPMLSLILVNEQYFSELKVQILSTQPIDQRVKLSASFDKLMADVSRTLEPKNRDKFTQNLTVFRHEFRAK